MERRKRDKSLQIIPLISFEIIKNTDSWLKKNDKKISKKSEFPHRESNPGHVGESHVS